MHSVKEISSHIHNTTICVSERVYMKMYRTMEIYARNGWYNITVWQYDETGRWQKLKSYKSISMEIVEEKLKVINQSAQWLMKKKWIGNAW